ncbi:amine dehydrogenase large subunit [Pseudomonas nitroreducens]|uniref:Amine dehydrogenase n=1 Tax=Pseudomonas nitroreducens TaxID=46680 RepID=A0ABS0KKI7_PSENT|nr:amine dehydrogenase large subunit [Pseudomonas nitroreducens]MBG6288585.1 amine dehydrogenase [Pseudomonas nitroreducens]NMZ59122.1 amine dehydrogenase [Pseudomonas nitroreducens]SNS73883.1 methylamine dehydrogenase heavy chain [Pseudomonas nitroreducens]
MSVARFLAPSVLALATCLAMSAAHAELPTESIGETVLPFPPSPHRAYIVDVEFENFIAGRVTVVDPEQKKMLGMVSTGFVAPSTLSHDEKTLYSADTFYSRGTRGVRTDVLTAWDTSNLRPKWEVEIPAKRASILTQKYALGTSSDDRFVYIYNFTPSTSVTVVDTQEKKVASEIAISGCVLNYPVGKRAFASLCGDGQLQITKIGDDGKEVGRSQTPFFDPNKEKLNERGLAVGETYFFVTTDGMVKPVDVSGDKPKMLPSWSLTTDEERKKGWGTGGWQLMAVAPKLNRMYVLMHEEHSAGKWEDPSPFIWVYDLKTQKKIGTLEAPKPVWSLHATTDDKPLLLGTDIEGGLQIFDLKTGKYNGAMDKIAKTPILVLSH